MRKCLREIEEDDRKVRKCLREREREGVFSLLIKNTAVYIAI